MRKKSPNFARSFLYPFSLIFGFIVFVRNRLFDYNLIKSEEFNIPIISVGNITVGGTGKTPHIEYLISILKDHFNIAVLSRGYKRRRKSIALPVRESHQPAEWDVGEKGELRISNCQTMGDEPYMLSRNLSGVPVIVDKDRIRAAGKAIAK